MARQTEQQKKNQTQRNRDLLLASIHLNKDKDNMWIGEKRNDGIDELYVNGKPRSESLKYLRGPYTKNPIEDPSLVELFTRKRAIPPFRYLSEFGTHLRNKNREKLRGW